MANRRMFSTKIVNTGYFTSMSSGAQALYFHMVMDADDEGFVVDPRNSMFKANASADDLNVLIGKGFVIKLGESFFVIKHWFFQNSLDKNHFSRSNFREHESDLFIKPDGIYTLDNTHGVPLIACITDDGLDRNRLKKLVTIEEKQNAHKMRTKCAPNININLSLNPSLNNKNSSKVQTNTIDNGISNDSQIGGASDDSKPF